MMNLATGSHYSDAEQRLFAAVFANSFESMMITDHHGVVVRVNPAFSRVTGYRADEVVSKHWRMLQLPDADKLMSKSLWRALRRDGYWQGELWSMRKSGELYPQQMSISPIIDDARNVMQYIIIFTDITEKKRAEEKIHRLAYYDILTDLPNRVLFLEQLSQVMTLARRNKHWVSLLFLDLDRFKEINDSLGHPVGDQLLQEASVRLRQSVRDKDRVARMGGDEFTVILGGLPNQEVAMYAAKQVAQKILDIFSQPFHLDGREVFVTVSMGIAFYPQDSIHTTELIKNADLAMYHAKTAGKNNYKFYTTRMNFTAMVRLDIEHRLHRALQNGELQVFYQPQVDANTRKLCGMESSVRWHALGQQEIPPSYFIRLAEETGLICSIGEWVFKQVCRQVVEWVKEGLDPPPVAINLSARQFMQPELVDTIYHTLIEVGLDPKYIHLEITESALMEDVEKTTQILHRLKGMGIHLAVDDFGTGYSSLNYLKRFPVDYLKIDRAFVKDIEHDVKSQDMISAIIAMAKQLHMDVMAEGVETLQQKSFLLEKECPKMQGFYFFSALSADQIREALLHKDTIVRG